MSLDHKEALVPLGYRKALDSKAVKDATGKAKPVPWLALNFMLNTCFSTVDFISMQTLATSGLNATLLPTQTTEGPKFFVFF